MTLKVGKHIDGWCTRCKLVLGHTIESMTGEKVTRVHCNTCGGQHAHRARAPRARVAGARASGTPGSRPPTKEQKRENEYAALLRRSTKASSRPYSTSMRFAVGEVISHDTLGLGVVTGERDSIKIDVLFADGPKVLVQGR
jgi:hypothetical protein